MRRIIQNNTWSKTWKILDQHCLYFLITFSFVFQQTQKDEMLNDDGDELEEEERVKRKKEEQIEKEREERVKQLNEWKVTCSCN